MGHRPHNMVHQGVQSNHVNMQGIPGMQGYQYPGVQYNYGVYSPALTRPEMSLSQAEMSKMTVETKLGMKFFARNFPLFAQKIKGKQQGMLKGLPLEGNRVKDISLRVPLL